MRAAAGVLAVAAVLALLVGLWLGRGGDPEAERAAQLSEVGLTLYLPELAGNLPSGVVDEVEPGVDDQDPAPAHPGGGDQPRPTQVRVTKGVVFVTYTVSGRPTYTLTQQTVPVGPLCQSVAQPAGSDCTVGDGVLRSSMEEMATLAVVRGGTLLVLRGLVVEANPGLLDAAVTALQTAPAVSAEELASIAD